MKLIWIINTLQEINNSISSDDDGDMTYCGDKINDPNIEDALASIHSIILELSGE